MAKLLYTFIKTNNIHNSSIRSDEGLTLETSALQLFHGGNSTFINSFEKPNFYVGEMSRQVRPGKLYDLYNKDLENFVN